MHFFGVGYHEQFVELSVVVFNEIHEVADKVERAIRYYFVFSRPRYLEAIPACSGKDKAIKYFVEKFGYGMEDTAAFGDSNNDTDMLRTARFGVAMGNAREECKLAADCVTDTNDNDGLAVMLESFIL